MDPQLTKIADRIYNYHNLGTGVFPAGEEKTPCGSGERYNFDRMYMIVSHYDLFGKRVLDLGCNSGWFSVQSKFLGAAGVVGVDYAESGTMGGAIEYAMAFEKRYQLGLRFVNADLNHLNLSDVARAHDVDHFDATLLLSTLHHIQDKDRFFESVYAVTRDVVFYEDHEFWNDLLDDQGKPIAVKGEGYRFGWNEDMSWQRTMSSIGGYEAKVLEQYMQTWRRQTLMLDRFAEVRLLGFSEKRRPVLALCKRPLQVTGAPAAPQSARGPGSGR